MRYLLLILIILLLTSYQTNAQWIGGNAVPNGLIMIINSAGCPIGYTIVPQINLKPIAPLLNLAACQKN